MSAPTVNRASGAVWGPYFGRRHTVNGVMGALMFVAAPVATFAGRGRIIECPNGCGHKRMDYGGPHAPRFVDGVQVNCVGVPL